MSIWAVTKELAKGAASHLPVVYRSLAQGTGGTTSARYCYSVWLRHLVMCHLNSLPTAPKVVAELGPGDSIGTGLAALLSGAERYFGLDFRVFTAPHQNLAILSELVDMFARREPIPGPDEFPEVKPLLREYSFPDHLLNSARLESALAPSRVFAIRKALEVPSVRHDDGAIINYIAPWDGARCLRQSSLDMIFSQAVLEHIDKLGEAYAAMRFWLKPGGVSSHQIDFRSHGTASAWNGHWAYSARLWRLMRGRRPYVINRLPYSVHIRLLRDNGFRVAFEQRVEKPGAFPRASLSPDFEGLTDQDLITAGLFVQAVRV